MSTSSETRLSLDAKDDELSENVLGDDNVVRPIRDQEEPLERNVATDDSDNLKDEEAAAPVNPLSSNAAQMLPMLQNLLHLNQIQRENLIGLIQVYDPTVEEGNAIVNTEEEQIATEPDLSSEIDYLEQCVEMLKDELEHQKNANAQLVEQLSRLRTSSEP